MMGWGSFSVCRQLLETGDKNLLTSAFIWASTPQGFSYWAKVRENPAPLTESDILLIEGIMLEETFITP
jgi:hypothetical protein